MNRTVTTVLLLATMLTGCLSLTADEFAQSVFPDLIFDEVLAYKPRSNPSYGCTYLVLKLPLKPEVTAPRVGLSDTATADEAVWNATGDAHSVELSNGHQCLVGSADKFDGVGVGGFSGQLREVLQQQGAWFANYGGVEGQKLLIYAPQMRLVVWMRFGD